MPAEENKALMRRVVDEVFNRQNVTAIDELFSPGYVDHDPISGQDMDRDGFKQFAAELFTAFPDFRVTIEDMLADGDRVMYRGTMTGTHTGDFMGMHPTGRRFSVMEMHIDRVVNGKIVEHWGLIEVMSMLQQLGIIHQPDEAQEPTPDSTP